MTCFWCNYAEKAEQTRNVYGSCDIADGNPCTVCDQYAKLESQIQDTKRILEQQLAQQRELQEAMNRVHDRIVPNIPTEIVSHIFQHSLSASWETSITQLDMWEFTDKGDRCGPLNLGAVCRAWRQIAWSTPQLWTFICQKICPSKSSTAALMEDWLYRAGDLPLSVWLSVSEHTGVSEMAHLENVVGLVNSHSHRWQNLGIYGPYGFLRLFYGNSQGAPILHTLELHCSPNGTSQGRFRLKGAKPRPRHVSIHTKLKITDIKVDINWIDVTHLRTSSHFPAECHKMISQTPNLESWCIANVNTIAVTLDSVSHQKLRSLEIVNVIGVRDLFNALILPGLTTLSFDMIHRDDEVYDAIISLLRNSSLKALSLRTFGNKDILINILKHLPFLEELRIYLHNSNRNDTNSLFSLLGDTGAGAHVLNQGEEFLPNLRSLTYQDFDIFNLDWGAISLLSTRKRPLNSLTIDEGNSRKFYQRSIFFGIKIEKHIILRFLGLEEAGVRLNLPVPARKDDLLKLLTTSNDDN